MFICSNTKISKIKYSKKGNWIIFHPNKQKILIKGFITNIVRFQMGFNSVTVVYEKPNKKISETTFPTYYFDKITFSDEFKAMSAIIKNPMEYSDFDSKSIESFIDELSKTKPEYII